MPDSFAPVNVLDLGPADDSQAQRDEQTVRAKFWPKIKRVIAQLPFAEDLLAGYYCAFDRGTPRHVRIALLGALAYFVLPADAIPDLLPMLGFTDDALVIGSVIQMVASNITPAHRTAARQALDDLIAV